MSIVDCYNCSYLKRRWENYYSADFIGGGYTGAKWSRIKFLMPHALCRHESCFKKIDGKKTRMIGQAQLNKNHDCPYYKEKWWRCLRNRN